MAIVGVKFSTDAFVGKVWLDGVRVSFSAAGVAQKNLADGRRHILQWVVRGAPTDKYSIEVTKPASVKRKLATNSRLGADKIGYGQYRFQL